MATPGVVNPKRGAIEMAPNITGLDHLNVVALLGEKLGSPVVPRKTNQSPRCSGNLARLRAKRRQRGVPRAR